MKKCNVFIKKEDKLDRYCSMKCDSGACSYCRLNDAKGLIFKMEQCSGENVDCAKCEYIEKFRRISPSLNQKLSRVR